jgi:hypothetical protein
VSTGFLTSIPLKNRLKCVSHNRAERALFESQFLQRKNGRVAQRLLLLAHFRFAEGLGPQARCNWGCPLELREVWASKSLLSQPADPGTSNYEIVFSIDSRLPQGTLSCFTIHLVRGNDGSCGFQFLILTPPLKVA